MAKILAYDADPNFREVMRAALTALGHEPLLATDGYGVLPLAEQHRPRLVILDYRPPEVDGFQILTRLRGIPACAATPIIFASATPKFEIEMAVMNAAAVGYVDKPLDVRQLKAAIEALIGAAVPAPKPAAAPPPAKAPPPVFNGEADLDGTRDDVIDLD